MGWKWNGRIGVKEEAFKPIYIAFARPDQLNSCVCARLLLPLSSFDVVTTPHPMTVIQPCVGPMKS